MPELVNTGDPDINMCNRNTRLILAALGLDTNFEEAPSMDVRDLEMACKSFLGNGEGKEVISAYRRRTGGKIGNVLDVGIDPNYYRERITQIMFACGDALDLGATHAYFA